MKLCNKSFSAVALFTNDTHLFVCDHSSETSHANHPADSNISSTDDSTHRHINEMVWAEADMQAVEVWGFFLQQSTVLYLMDNKSRKSFLF